uniref:LAM_G_DOMAIN domain-containing protein n=1 Tax=Haemonchus contortus TaxID=6289 RepID=A0A7I4Y2J0_HAECO|nr:Protein EFF-1, isoform a [Haemonchus contortus]
MRIVLCLYLVTWISAGIIDDLPHCARSTVMEGEIREYDNMGRPKIYSAVQLSMALHEVACMTIKMNDSESSILHTLEFLRLEQHHPVSGMYQFGIPKITSSCICDCAGGDAPCKMSEYNYRNCTSGALCYRTYHPVQSNVGCLSEQKSEACCQLRIEPFRDWIFTAIKINQPATVLVFKYNIYDRFGNRWRRASEEVVEVPMNRGIFKFDFNNIHKIEMVVSGSRPNRELQPGMYFLREGTHELRGFVPINDIGESNLEKLGWMRYTDGKWDIRNGLVKIKQAHHVNVADCKQQIYTSTINGEQMVLVSGSDVDESYDLGRPLTDDPWIETAVYQDRAVRVEHAEGTSITVHMTSETRPHMLRHISQLESFDGMIQVDRDSNRYLNISFLGSKGTLIGNIFSSEKKDQIDMAFSVQVDSKVHHYRSIISIPSSINSSRYVCFHPSGDVKGEICKWFKYETKQLNSYRVAHRWQRGHGDCSGCNERGVESFLTSLDPRQWFNGISTPVEAFTMAVELVIAVCLLLLFVGICTKCLIPLLRCTFSVSKTPKK